MSIKTILKSIGNFIGGLLPFAKNAITVGRDVATEIKEIADNPLWDVVTSLTSTKLDDIALTALRGYLAALLKDLALSDPNETGFGVILKQASLSLKAMEVPEAKAGTLNTISAAMATKYAELNGKTLPIETTLSTAQPAYIHPELLEKK